MDWKPISTAPWGQTVLVCNPEMPHRGFAFRNAQGEWEAVTFAGQPTGTGFYPTHWTYFEWPEDFAT